MCFCRLNIVFSLNLVGGSCKVSIHPLFLSSQRHHDGFFRIIFIDRIILNMLVQRTAPRTLPSFRISTIATPSWGGPMKVDFMTIVIGISKARVAKNDAGRVCLACATVPSNISPLKDVSTLNRGGVRWVGFPMQCLFVATALGLR